VVLVHIEGLELAQEVRRIRPGLDPDLPHDSMDGHDLPHL
jgi:hypothetical protein